MFWFIVCCVLFAACIAVFIAILSLPPVNRTNTIKMPIRNPDVGGVSGLQQSFLHSDGSIQILDPLKPFYVALTKDGPIKNGIVFSNIQNDTDLQRETERTSHGFFFSVFKQTTLVALQIIDSLFASGNRQIGIFNTTTKELMRVANVSKQQDILYQGFRTRALEPSQHIQLVPNVLYACVALVLENDFVIVKSNVMFPINNVSISGVGRISGTTLNVPTSILTMPFSSPFASFQLQDKLVPKTVVFEVDSQYARFPPYYIQGLKLEVLENNTIEVTKGYCASVYADANLVSDYDMKLKLSNLIADTWYAVFIVDSNVSGIYSPHLEISTNYAELSSTPTHRYRRIGWARTHAEQPLLLRCEQEGTECRRDTIFMESVLQDSFDIESDIVKIITLSHVPPSANECRLEIVAAFSDDLWFVLPQENFDIFLNDKLYHMFHSVGTPQSYQIHSITLPLDSTSIPQHISFRAIFDGGVSNLTCNFTFKILNFTEDL